MDEDSKRAEEGTPSGFGRYARQIILPEVGPTGQRKLGRASILIVGAGGLGSPAALYLAAAGVGRLGIVDFDRVDESNLHRQILHSTSELGRPKVASAKRRLNDLNPGVHVEAHDLRLSQDEIVTLMQDYDIVLDGSDNFATRYLVNDAAVRLAKPLVYGSVLRFEGQASVFVADDGPCYRCLFPHPPAPGQSPSCAEAGVLGVLPGIVGTIQAGEAIKVILGIGNPLIGRLLRLDALAMDFQELALERDTHCPACGENPSVELGVEGAASCGTPRSSSEASDGDGPPQQEEEVDEVPWEISPEEAKQRLEMPDAPRLLDIREPREIEIGSIPGSDWIRMDEIPSRLAEIDPEREIIVYCHLGMRSAMVVDFLRRHGCRRARNLSGGIDAWSRDIDPAIPRY